MGFPWRSSTTARIASTRCTLWLRARVCRRTFSRRPVVHVPAVRGTSLAPLAGRVPMLWRYGWSEAPRAKVPSGWTSGSVDRAPLLHIRRCGCRCADLSPGWNNLWRARRAGSAGHRLWRSWFTGPGLARSRRLPKEPRSLDQGEVVGESAEGEKADASGRVACSCAGRVTQESSDQMSSRDTCLTQESEAPSGRNSCVRLTQQAQLSCPHREGCARSSAEPFLLPVSMRLWEAGPVQCREERKASGSPCTCHQEVGLAVGWSNVTLTLGGGVPRRRSVSGAQRHVCSIPRPRKQVSHATHHKRACHTQHTTTTPQKQHTTTHHNT